MLALQFLSKFLFGKLPFGGILTSGLFIGFVFPFDFPLKVFGLMETLHTKSVQNQHALIPQFVVILGSFLSQGIVAERDDNCCPACYAKSWETNLSSCVLALQFPWEFLLANFLLEVFYVYLWSFYRLCISLRFSLQSFWPYGNTPNQKNAKITCLDTMIGLIGGHSKFRLGTGKFCNKRWQLLSCFAKLSKTSLFSCPWFFFLRKVFSVGILCVPLFFLNIAI